MRETNHAVIVDAIRIPIGRRKGVYSDTRSEHLLTHVIKG